MNRLAGRRILIVDDEQQMRHLVGAVLGKEGATVFTAGDGAEGLRMLYESRPDLVLLDVLMPRVDGWEVLRQIRQMSEMPVIMLTVLDRPQNEARALREGATDYITKPFDTECLLARVENALRARPPLVVLEEYYDGYLCFDWQQRRTIVGGQKVHLTRKEGLLLHTLIKHRDRLCSYEMLLRAVWGSEGDSTVDNVHVFIWQLRQKIEPDPKIPVYILNRHGEGYLFASRQPSQPGTYRSGGVSPRSDPIS
jgi:two-component system KDP operon response regulator KdpE